MTLIAAFGLGRSSTNSGGPLSLNEEESVKSVISTYFFDDATSKYHLVLMIYRLELLATHEFTVEHGQLPPLKPIIRLCLEAGAASMIGLP